MQKILVIQTSFIGDVILATAVLEKLHHFYPKAQLDILVRKGNESLLIEHPFVHEVLVWEKKENKLKNLWATARRIRKTNYDVVVNLHRFGSSGFLTAYSGAKEKIGFKKNPFALFFTKQVEHHISSEGTLHEVERNQLLIEQLTDENALTPRLYPSVQDEEKAKSISGGQDFITLSPASIWFTKQLPLSKWVELINKLPLNHSIYILGGPADKELGEELKRMTKHNKLTNLCGELSLLGSAALMKLAKMNYVNDSAPLHLCSAMNAPVTAFFCSTLPAFGFGPLSDQSIIMETKEDLLCRPCGLHGHRACPENHFRCGQIDLSTISEQFS